MGITSIFTVSGWPTCTVVLLHVFWRQCHVSSSGAKMVGHVKNQPTYKSRDKMLYNWCMWVAFLHGIYILHAGILQHVHRLIQLLYLWNRTFRLILDKLSFTAVNFIRSENNQTLLQLFVLLRLSVHMLWIHSMLRVSYANLWMPIG